MKRFINSWSLPVIAGCALLLSPVQSLAQEKKPENPAEKSGGEQGDIKKAPNPNRSIPFRGKVDAVDKAAKTVKVGTRVFLVNADTKIQKDNKAGTLDDIAVGEPIRGAYRQAEDGKMTAISLSLGAKAAETGATGEKPSGSSEIIKSPAKKGGAKKEGANNAE